MSRKLHRPVLDTTGIVVPIKQGGSSADTLTQGAIALEMLTLDQIDLANRIPSLDATGHLSDTVVPVGLIFDSLHLEGPEIVAVNGTAKIYITDYDQYKTYAVSASAGFAAHSDGVIYFKAPSVTGPVTITVNDRDYTLTVDDYYVLSPDVITPTQDYTNVGSAFVARLGEFQAIGMKSFKSLRFKGVNSYMYKIHSLINNPGTALTFSMWVKRGSLNTQQCLFGYSNGSTASYVIQFDSSNRLDFSVYSGAYIARKITTQVFTDSAWHHIVINHDTSKVNAADRIAVYVDNNLVQSFAVSQDPTLNNIMGTGNYSYAFGTIGTIGGSFLDGYLSEINFIDGQALTPASFGEIDPILNIWSPKAYTGAYGSNGFYLDFVDPSSLFNLGQDKSGKGNNWICTNISLTAGMTYDSLDDSVVENYPTWVTTNSILEYRSAGMEATTNVSPGAWYKTAVSNFTIPSTGKWYWEMTEYGSTSGDYAVFGLLSIDVLPNAHIYVGGGVGSYGCYIINAAGGAATWYSDGVANGDMGTVLPELAGGVEGPAVGFAFDADNNTIELFVNGASRGKRSIPANQSGKLRPAASLYVANVAFNAGQRPFSNTPPVGFTGLYTPQLHTSTDWQVSDDADFSTVLQQSTADVSNKRAWSISGLQEDTDYFLRARYNSTQLGTSEWSDVRHIKTRSSWLPVNEQQILTASDKVAADNFGIRVSISADGTRLVVGAYFADPSGLSAAGKAYIYVKTNGVWVQEAVLTASNKATNDYFGVGVSMCADGTRVAIGAYNKTVGGLASAGAVYVFSRSGSTWTQEAILTASDKAAADQLGQGLAIDATGTRVVAGALESGANNAGAAYVFSRSGTVWAQEAKLTASDGASIDYLGLSASITANGDRVLVSSYGADVGGTADAGAAYVFVRSGTSWTQEAKLSASDKAVSDNFSFRVNISSDGTRAIIGAHNADPSGVASAGKAYIFIRSGSTWSEEAILTASNKAANDLFGADVNISSDGSIAAVAAYSSEFAGYTDCGVVYLFTRTGSTWSQQAILSASDKGNTSYFGHSLDMDETASTLLIGALNASPSGVAGAGSAYIFS